MKKTWKLLLTIVVAALLTAVLCVCAFASEGAIATLSVKTGDAADPLSPGAVRWYEDPYSGKYFLFLPEETDRENMTVWFSADAPVTVGGKTLVTGMPTDAFAGGDEFTVMCGGTAYDLVIMSAPGSAAIFINTESGSMDAINASKSVKEAGSIRVVDADGTIQYDGALEYIKGRGNSTWLNEKKPYNIKLDKKAELFGMEKSKKWCLLANATDLSIIRNSLNYDMARTLGIETTSDVIALNLYCNGAYMGAYALTEKVEIASGRVDIYDLEDANEKANELDPEEYPLGGGQNIRSFNTYKYASLPNDPDEITGGYLLELEKLNRYPDEASGFVTEHGQAVVVKEPEFASKAEVEYIRDYYAAFEEAFYAQTGYNQEGRHYTDYLDAKSLAMAYILQEFCENYDGCSSSFYLYKDVDGKLTYGPAWDLDLALGSGGVNKLITPSLNNANPSNFYQMNTFLGYQDESLPSLLAQAMNHADFRELVYDLWKNVFTPYFNTFGWKVDTIGAAVNDTAAMNAIRWHYYGTSEPAEARRMHLSTLEPIKAFAQLRFATLNPIFSQTRCFVRYDTNRMSSSMIRDLSTYAPGSQVTLPNAKPRTSLPFLKLGGWSTEPDGGGEIYPAGTKVTIDKTTTFYAVWVPEDGFSNKLASFFERVRTTIRLILHFFTMISV